MELQQIISQLSKADKLRLLTAIADKRISRADLTDENSVRFMGEIIEGRPPMRIIFESTVQPCVYGGVLLDDRMYNRACKLYEAIHGADSLKYCDWNITLKLRDDVAVN